MVQSQVADGLKIPTFPALISVQLDRWICAKVQIQMDRC